MPAGDQRKPVVLLVEDEALIASFLTRALAQAGCEVLGPFAHPDAALRALDKATTTVDCAILDGRLAGGQTSLPVAQRLHDTAIPFLFLTGFGSVTDIGAGRFPEIKILQKPVRLATLLAEVQALLGRTAGPSE